MKYLKTVSISLLVIASALAFGSTEANAIPESSSCSTLWSNCTATAIENYDNGTYTFAEFYAFYSEICPQAYDECIRSPQNN
jgi:hypothetical protein